MTFGPNSNNPRERRAYAHAMLAKARASGEDSDFEAAQNAVNAAGTSRKSRASNFGAALITAALSDPVTHTIVEAGQYMLDPATRGQGAVYPIDDLDSAIFYRKKLEGYSAREGTAHIASRYNVKADSAPKKTLADLCITEEVSGPVWDVEDLPIPVQEDVEAVDVIAVRLIPEETRLRMSALIGQFPE